MVDDLSRRCDDVGVEAKHEVSFCTKLRQAVNAGDPGVIVRVLARSWSTVTAGRHIQGGQTLLVAGRLGVLTRSADVVQIQSDGRDKA